MKLADDDVYIHMTPLNLAKAISLAMASSRCTKYGPCETKALHAMAGESEQLECAYYEENGEAVVAAITGNGTASAANAEFYCDARAIVLGMAKRIEELEASRMVGPFSGGRWRHG